MKLIDLSSLLVKKVIIHEVKKQSLRREKQPPVFSQTVSKLDQDLRLFLKDRIVGTLSRDKSFEVVFINPQTSFASVIMARLLSQPDDFVEISKDVATELNRVQGGNSPTGLVTIIDVSVNNSKGIAILKLEREEGARIHQSQVDGKLTFDLLHLRDLILTEKTKLFKIALFFDNCKSVYGYDGKVCDNQLISAERRDIATFFLETFLGCIVAGDPKADTRDFFYASQDFFNEEVEDSLQASSYTIHLISQMTQDKSVVSPKQFATECLAACHRDPYIAFLEKKGVKAKGFKHDTTLIKQHLEQLVLEFENGVRIVGKKDNFREAVKLTKMDNGRTRAEVVSKLRSIKS